MLSSAETGSEVRLLATFRDIAGVITDPTTVVCKIKDPARVITLPTVQHQDVGVFYAEIVLDQVGIWSYRFEGTGALVASHESEIFVVPTAFD